ncbi:MAG: 50S ribosomal protein L11 methyltransferase [Christensenellales bacterium]|jgi:ribosomal protein L11 methyltransferase
MDWMQVTVLTTTAGAELVSEILSQEGSSGSMIEDRNDIDANQRPEGAWDIIDPDIALRMGEDVRVSGYFPKELQTQDLLSRIRARLEEVKRMELLMDVGKLEIETSTVDDEDWAEFWKKNYVPFRLGMHMVVKPTWTPFDAQEGDKIIELDPGMAFGSGTHETTGMCVEILEKVLKKGDSVIDVGTGSGILAIAAALNGAGDVLAIDIDPMAVRVCGENVERNGFSDVVRCRQGDLLKDVEEVADIVVANIISDVIIMIAEPVKARIKPGGMFLCSGISRERRDEVIEALEKADYASIDVHIRGEWAAIECRVKA